MVKNRLGETAAIVISPYNNLQTISSASQGHLEAVHSLICGLIGIPETHSG
jgi:hypothetical protein